MISYDQSELIWNALCREETGEFSSRMTAFGLMVASHGLNTYIKSEFNHPDQYRDIAAFLHQWGDAFHDKANRIEREQETRTPAPVF